MSITCAVCQNTDFYEDGEGQLSCSLCGIQSQDFLAVSNDIDENIADNRNEKRKWQTHKVTTPKSDGKKSSKRDNNPSTKEYIELFQYCLKFFVSSVPTGSDHHLSRLIAQVKHLWVR
jgi:uncharacterized Zn finger protein (UPF0148 family)